jgi:uncharacterized protein (DUF433 family)
LADFGGFGLETCLQNGERKAILPLNYAIENPMKTKLSERITLEAGKCGGRPCIRSQRMRVTDILSLLSAGASHQEIITDYPFLENDDILAALEYAAAQTDHATLFAA